MEHVTILNSVLTHSESVAATNLADHGVKLLREQVTLHAQQTQLLRAEVALLHSRLNAETIARLNSQV